MAAPRTTFIVAADRDALILEKLAGLEQAMEGLVPLLEQIITQLEGLAPPRTVPMATYDDLYAADPPGPPEGELVAALPVLPADRQRWWARLWGREV